MWPVCVWCVYVFGVFVCDVSVRVCVLCLCVVLCVCVFIAQKRLILSLKIKGTKRNRLILHPGNICG